MKKGITCLLLLLFTYNSLLAKIKICEEINASVPDTLAPNLINYQKTLLKGHYFKNLKLKDTSDQIFQLHSLKGNVIILHFWASTCGSSVLENEFLAALYKKYQNRGFKIYAVSFDDTKGDWKNALKTVKAPWINVSEPDNFHSSTAFKYGVNFVPRNILIDRNGIMVDINFDVELEASVYSKNIIKPLLMY